MNLGPLRLNFGLARFSGLYLAAAFIIMEPQAVAKVSSPL